VIDDLRHLPQDPFQIIEQEYAGWIIALALFVCWLADRMGWLA
jgi:hypothetical protein